VPRLHGHSFKVEVVVAGECDPELGWLMDYADITAGLQTDLGKAGSPSPQRNPRLENPTSEVIAVWIWQRLQPKLPLLTEIVVAVKLHGAGVYRGE